MNENTLEGKKLELYVLLKILKYCTDSSIKSYQCKFAVDRQFMNNSIKSMEEVGAALKKIIQYNTLRGKFSSVNPDLAAKGITRVEVGEEGLHFITQKETGIGWNKKPEHDRWSFLYRLTYCFTDDEDDGNNTL